MGLMESSIKVVIGKTPNAIITILMKLGKVMSINESSWILERHGRD